MIVSGLSTWFVAIIAVLITAIYYFRYRKGWMGHPLAVLFIFAIHFFFFAWGIVIFLLTEWIRAKNRGRYPKR